MTTHEHTGLLVGTPEWQDAHLGKISGSTAADILCAEGCFQTPLHAWARITGKATTEDNPILRWGRYSEEMAARWWQDEHPDLELHDSPGMIQDAEVAWHVGTPDGLVPETERYDLWEGKSAYPTKREQWASGSVPEAYRVQTQLYARLVDADLIYFAALVQPDAFFPVIERNDRFIERAMDYLNDWHERYVVKDIEPPALAPDSRLLQELHPNDNGRFVFLMNADVADRDKELEREIKTLGKQRDELHAKVKQAIGDNTYGQVDGERRYSWKTAKNGSRILRLGKIKKGELEKEATPTND